MHVVFTLPHELAPLAFHNKKILYTLLFRTSAATLLEIAADPKHLGAEIGFLSVLHTWGQNLLHHPHVHCVIPAGGLSPDHQRWVHPRYPFFLPVRVLSRVFRGKFVAGLKRAYQKGDLCFPGSLKPLAQDRTFRSLLRSLFRKDWVVYANRHSADRNTCSTIWPATRIAWPSPIIGWLILKTARSRFAGRTMPTETNEGS